MNIFEKYFGKNQNEINAGKKDLVEKKVKRGFASALDQLEEIKIDEAEKAERYRVQIANGNTERIADLFECLVKIEDAEQMIKAGIAEEKAFFAEK